MNRPNIIQADTHFGFLNASAPAEQLFNPLLINNADENTMLKAIRRELSRSTSFTFSVAFITRGALALLKQALLDYHGDGTIITSDYLDFNEPDVFHELLDLPNISVKIHAAEKTPFHAKGYVFRQGGSVTAIVGSSNLTRNALLINQEWNIRFSALPDGDVTYQLAARLAEQEAASIALTPAWIENYAKKRRPQLDEFDLENNRVSTLPVGRIEPNQMQLRALEALERLWNEEARRALIVSATGTGKTILAALAARQMEPQRMLFLVHREQILDKAIEEFRKVFDLPEEEFGKCVGAERSLDRRFVFSTIQTFSRRDFLDAIEPDYFDFVIIDEVHRAGANSYLRTIEHLTPKRLLGLTATPQRTDDFNVYELFDHNVAFEIHLQEALEEGMLAPFNYYGVTDFENENGEVIDDTSALSRLVAPERVKHLLTMIERYGHKSNVCGLIFCSSKVEANQLSVLLNSSCANGRRLRTESLTGQNSIAEREDAVERLTRGELDYLLTVDIFNEGIDIPSINQVVMLRNTKSSIVFTQQLGRGLRKTAGKDHLRVIDFIGNYSNNFLVPIALFGDSSLNKYSVRQKMLDAQNNGAIAGVSSVSFDEISRERVLSSLATAKLDSFHNLKKAFTEVENMLGDVPSRLDLATIDRVDPVTLIRSGGPNAQQRNYCGFLSRLGKLNATLSSFEHSLLTFLDNELLNGKRPHELLLLRSLLKGAAVSRQSYVELLRSEGLPCDEHVIASVESVLTLDFFTTTDSQKFAQVLEVNGSTYSLEEKVTRALITNQTLRSHVDDIIATGLHLARHRYNWSQPLTVGKIYSRKDATRLLNWRKTHIPQNIGGYMVDAETKTCPIFVTYEKRDEISESTRYEDEFLDRSRMHWFTKSRRTLKSKSEGLIAAGAVQLHLFVKKSDLDEGEFFYLGEATPCNAHDSTMPAKNKPVKVVEMDLLLKEPVQESLYDFFLSTNTEYSPEPSHVGTYGPTDPLYSRNR